MGNENKCHKNKHADRNKLCPGKSGSHKPSGVGGKSISE